MEKQWLVAAVAPAGQPVAQKRLLAAPLPPGQASLITKENPLKDNASPRSATAADREEAPASVDSPLQPRQGGLLVGSKTASK